MLTFLDNFSRLVFFPKANFWSRFLFTMGRVDGAEVRKYSRAIEDGYSYSAR
jgi:hypothetical protein